MKRLAILLCLLSFSSLIAQIPQTINYQGKLTDPDGVAIDTPVDITFAIYDVPTGGTALWTENHTSVPVNHGLFDVILGETTSLDLPFDQPYYIELTVDGEVLSPRTALNTVAYSFHSEMSDSTGAVHWDDVSGAPTSFDPSSTNELITNVIWNDLTNRLLIVEATTHAVVIDNEADDLSDNVINDLSDVDATPAIGQVLGWNGTDWTAVDETDDQTLAEVLTSGNTANMDIDMDGHQLQNLSEATTAGEALIHGQTAGGDLSGNYPDPTVIAIQGNAVTGIGPSDNQILKWNSTAGEWQLAADQTGSSGDYDHNDLAGIQGGAADNYYHLTVSDYNTLTNADATVDNADAEHYHEASNIQDVTTGTYIASDDVDGALGELDDAIDANATDISDHIAADGDLDDTNELISSVGYDSGTDILTVTEAGTPHTVDLSALDNTGTDDQTLAEVLSEGNNTGGASIVDGTDGQVDIDDNLLVTGDSRVVGDIYVSNNSIYLDNGSNTVELHAPTITVNRQATFPDATGEVTLLGQTIESGEITDGTINEADLNIDNAPTDEYVLSYDSGTGHFEWVADNGGTDNQEDIEVPLTTTGDFTVISGETEVHGALDDLDAAVATNQADIATNQADIAVNQTNIATNQTNIATNATDIANHVAADGDLDDTNEFNTSMGWDDVTNTVSVVDGGGTQSAVITGFADGAHNHALTIDGDADGSGTVPGTISVTVDAIQGRSVETTAPSSGDIYKWDGTDWGPAADDDTDADADPTNELQDIVAGDGLTGGGSGTTVTLDANPDDSSIEVNADQLRVKALGIKDIHIDWGSGVNQVDADDLPFTPSTSGDWSLGADPGDTDDALDQLANRVDDLEGGAGSVTSISGGLGIDPDGATSGAVSLSADMTELSYTGLNAPTATSLNVLYGTAANNAVEGNETATITAGDGLTGGITGDVLGDGFSATLDVDFAGTGIANTVAHSDHNHDASYDNYNSWTATPNDGGTAISVTSGTNVSFDGTGGVNVTRGSGNTITIDGTAAGEDNQTITTGAGVSGAEAGTSGDFTITVNAGDGIDISGDNVAVDATDIAGTGLSESSNNLNVNFAGSGSANTSARSDHNHSGTYDNYGSWNLRSNTDASTSISSGETVSFTGTGGATVSRSTNTITIDASGAGDGNNYVNGMSFNTTDGVLTLTRLGLGNITEDLDGRYLTGEVDGSTTNELQNISTSGYGLSSSGSGTLNLSVSINSGNSSGDIPISNGTVNSNLNADMVDGHHYTSGWEAQDLYNVLGVGANMGGRDILANSTGSQYRVTHTSSAYVLNVENTTSYGLYWNAGSNLWAWYGAGAERGYIDLDNGNMQIDGDLTVSGGNIGIGTSASSSYGIYLPSGSATSYGALLYGTTAGGYFRDTGGAYGYVGYGSYGTYGAGSTYGAYGNGSSYGVYGYSSGTAGVYGYSNGNYGYLATTRTPADDGGTIYQYSGTSSEIGVYGDGDDHGVVGFGFRYGGVFTTDYGSPYCGLIGRDGYGDNVGVVGLTEDQGYSSSDYFNTGVLGKTNTYGARIDFSGDSFSGDILCGNSVTYSLRYNYGHGIIGYNPYQYGSSGYYSIGVLGYATSTDADGGGVGLMGRGGWCGLYASGSGWGAWFTSGYSGLLTRGGASGMISTSPVCGMFAGAPRDATVGGAYVRGNNLNAAGVRVSLVSEKDSHDPETRSGRTRSEDYDEIRTPVFSVDAVDVNVQWAGKAQLENGRANVQFDQQFMAAISDNEEPVIILTPASAGCQPLAVERTDKQGFSVVELNDGESDSDFNFLVIAKRKGYEERPQLDQTVLREDFEQKMMLTNVPGCQDAPENLKFNDDDLGEGYKRYRRAYLENNMEINVDEKNCIVNIKKSFDPHDTGIEMPISAADENIIPNPEDFPTTPISEDDLRPEEYNPEPIVEEPIHMEKIETPETSAPHGSTESETENSTIEKIENSREKFTPPVNTN